MRCCRRRGQVPARLPEETAVTVLGEPAREEPDASAGPGRNAPGPLAAAAPAAEAAAAPVPVAEQQATEEDLHRATRTGEAVHVRLAGARALPWHSAVTRRGLKTFFAVCRGSLAAGRPQAVVCGAWVEARHLACTAAGNIDSGGVFHGFRTTAEARA